jgi:serine/threonine-protein kinase RIO1
MLWHVAQLPMPIIQGLWQNPDQMVSGGSMLKDGDRCTVVRIYAQVSGVEKSFVLKRYNQKDAFHTTTHLLLRSRARWTWQNGRRLLGAGLPTPAPLACVDERRLGILRVGSYLLTEFIPGEPLNELIDSGKLEETRLRDIARQFVSIWQRLGQLQLGYGDMKASNFIVDPQGRLWLIDLDGMRHYHSRAMLRHKRRKDLARFMQNWVDHPEVAALFRARIGTG